MNRLRVYLAGPFAWQHRLSRYAQELRALGLEVGCRWLTEPAKLTGEVSDLTPAYCAETAAMDIEDVATCNVFIMFTPTDEELADPTISKKSWSRGGRNFEFGYAAALRLLNAVLNGMVFTSPQLIVCGPPENIFCHFDPVKNFPNWDTTVAHLLEIAHAEDSQSVTAS